MSLLDLITKYTDFIAILDDIPILSNLSFQTFHEYPKNIPKEIYEPISQDLSFAQNILNLYFEYKILFLYQGKIL